MFLFLLADSVVRGGPAPITVPLRALPENPNYFMDGSGKPVYLTGSHAWNTLQDWGMDGLPQPTDFKAFVKTLVAHHHNMTLLWTTELPVLHNMPTTAGAPPDITVTPLPWQRTGPGNATDGKPRFDLTKFNPAYFERLRDRTQQLNAAGIYAGVYFFTGDALYDLRSAHDGYPLSAPNNINGIDAGDGDGGETIAAPNAVSEAQDAFIRKMIDTLNDLPNVLWIVSEEAPTNSVWWNAHHIALARSYEATKPLQHPIGYGTLNPHYAGGDQRILDSDADWISPVAPIAPTRGCGGGHPACKVVINDTDHSYFGIWNDSPQANRNYFWLNFTQGSQTLFMDPYLVCYPRQDRNYPVSPVHGIGRAPDKRWDPVRDTMGYIRRYAERMNLAAARPRADLTSTGHALANTIGAHAEYLVYAPYGGNFTVDLSANDREFTVEWFRAASGVTTAGPPVRGGAVRGFNPPFDGDAVLYLH
jgi:hypothetical protein